MTESAHTSRRSFLKHFGAAGVATFVGTGLAMPLSRPIMAWATSGSEQPTVLVNIFLRGAADFLHICCPHGDDDYYRQRGDYGLSTGEFTDLDGFFGLHNSFSSLMPLWEDQELSFVHAAGSHHPTRSHFEAQPNMDTAFSTGGWLQRVIGASHFASPQSGLSIGDRTSPPLIGPFGGSVVSTIRETVASGVSLSVIRPAIEALYGDGAPTPERTAVLSGLASVDQISAIDPMPGEFPNTSVGRDLREAASLIRAGLGIRAIAIDFGGWDHHDDGLPRMEQSGTQLADALAAFIADLGSAADRTIVCVSTEFGRTVKPNGAGDNAGTDHGHGNAMMVIGKPLTGQGGGRVLTPGGWPGLADDVLWDGQDLEVTTDFRSIYSELAERHLGIEDLSDVFPGFTPEPVGLLHARGDVDGSGTIEVHDAQSVLDASVRRSGLAPVGDLDRDGDNDLVDAMLATQQAGGE